jgi:6-phosphogluconolactonase
MSVDAEIVVFSDPEAVAREAAQRFVHQAVAAIDVRGRFSVALSGGNTPGALYRLLAEEPNRQRVPWERVHLFWGDERCVPPDHPGSNYRLAAESMIDRVPIPPDNVHRLHGELKPEAAARLYAFDLVDFFCGPRPRFDLVLLGLGSDGHTASLFPGSPVLHERESLAVAVEARYGDRPAHRVTLTLPAINAARHVLFLVTGEAKAEIVHCVLDDPAGDLPAQLVDPVAGQLTWLLDAAAAAQCL